VPLALVVTEAAWASLLLNAAFDTSHGPRVQIGLLTLAVPAAVAVALGTAFTGPAPSRRRRVTRTLVLAVAVVAGTALSAGLIAELARSGSFWTVASRPWAASGHRAATVAGTAWFLAVLAWARGTWLGAAPPSSAHAARSVVVGALAFVGVFAARADTQATAFRAATGSAGWLLFIAFPCAVATFALIRQGELQDEVAPGARTGSTPVWMSVLAVPMLAVALVALLVAVAVGPAAPVVGRAIARAARAVWWLVVEIATALSHLIPRSPAHRVHRPIQPGNGSPTLTVPRPPVATHASAVPFALEIVVGVVALVVVLLAAVLLARKLRSRVKQRSPTGAAATETDSVFSWGHLASQLWQALVGLFARRRRTPAPVRPPTPAGEEELQTVRLAYRRFLTAARTSGWPRSASESTRELERRLAAGPAAGEAGSLAELTAMYDAVRYGDRPSGEQESAVALARADAVSTALAESTDASVTTPGP
jgi:hypothetical protein